MGQLTKLPSCRALLMKKFNDVFAQYITKRFSRMQNEYVDYFTLEAKLEPLKRILGLYFPHWRRKHRK